MEERSYDEVIAPTCPSCRSEVPPDANVCPNCGYRLRAEEKKAGAPPVAPAAAPQPRRGRGKSIAGGVLVMISGIIGIITGLSIAILASTAIDTLEGLYGAEVLAMMEGILVACGVTWFIIGLIALIGGIFAIRGKRWGIAVVGGVLALFTVGPYFIGSILGLVGLILVAISKDEFS